jgi:hemoglobin
MDQISAPYEHKFDPNLTSAVICRVVETFYAKARRDALLGPVFNRLVDDWDAHIEKVSAFWLYATRLDRTYKARDFMPAHVRHPQIQASLLPRWLSLFRQTVEEICTEDVAKILMEIAERMAASIEISLARRSMPSGAG